jgi:hypothetical protein
MNATLKQLRDNTIGAYEKLGMRYHSKLPVELDLWYCYLPDAGHSILCALEQHFKSGMSLEGIGEILIPLPVKTVLRSYRLSDGVPVVSGVEYDSMVGAMTPEEDGEMEVSSASGRNDSELWFFQAGARLGDTQISQLQSAGPEQAFIHDNTAFIVLPNISEAEIREFSGELTLIVKDAGDIGIVTFQYQNMNFDFPIGENAVDGNHLMIIVIDSQGWKVVKNRSIGINGDIHAFFQAKMLRAKAISEAQWKELVQSAYRSYDSLSVKAVQRFDGL